MGSFSNLQRAVEDEPLPALLEDEDLMTDDEKSDEDGELKDGDGKPRKRKSTGKQSAQKRHKPEEDIWMDRDAVISSAIAAQETWIEEQKEAFTNIHIKCVKTMDLVDTENLSDERQVKAELKALQLRTTAISLIIGLEPLFELVARFEPQSARKVLTSNALHAHSEKAAAADKKNDEKKEDEEMNNGKQDEKLEPQDGK